MVENFNLGFWGFGVTIREVVSEIGAWKFF